MDTNGGSFGDPGHDHERLRRESNGMEFTNSDFDARPEKRHANGGKEGVKEGVQCLATLAETLCPATPVAAFPSGGMNMGTTNADRIIKTAKPTKRSTSVKRQCSFFILVYPSPFCSGGSNSISKSSIPLPRRKYYNHIIINMLWIDKGPAMGGKGFAV